MVAICYSAPIFMKLFMNIIYLEKVRFIKFGYKISKNNKNQLIVCMTTVRYISPIRIIPNYLQRAVIRRACDKCHQNSFKTERLVCVSTDRRTHRRRDKRTDGQMNGRTDERTD